ncbi:DUF2867 domain-containing protein [Microbacterium sp. CFH 31415]|uniref:DUF2867 domain-containing protein n=1 Tax=Microbacterium sp. CFH 31415 TaxID=2921732 RepID=UPI001F144872|nr:DUF2867 domain-containing protein [Microbacterium sp. CFH 31415]MCH6230079.1 DUF2867 domain-containing protein [Microbacterium sp. CFH 31415]
MREPAFWSLALADIADPDYTQVWIDVLPAHATADPAAWARNLFSRSALPRWIAAPVALGALLHPRARACDMFTVRHVEGEEALVKVDARTVDLRVGVGVDEERALVRVVTAMRFKGRGARLRSLPVRLSLALLMRGMLARARRELSGVTR